MRIGREMRRHPIDDDADIGAMAGIDETGETLRRPEPRARREQAERLIAPRTAEWMLRHRHQLDMGEAHLADVGHQPLGQLIPGRNASIRMEPRRGVHLVDRHRRVGIVTARALPHPRLVVPDMRCRIGDDGRRGRRRFGRTRQRISLERQSPTVGPDDGKLVARAGPSRGMNSSHTPAGKRSRIGFRRGSHVLKSPTTETARAFGAQTANRTPCTPSIVTTLAPRCDASSKCRPSLNRCRSRSPSSGPKEYGSSVSCTASGQTMRSRYGSVLITRPTNRPCGVVGASRPSRFAALCAQYLDLQRAGQERADRSRPVAVSCGPSTANGSPSVPLASASATPDGRPEIFSHVVHAGTCAISWARPCNGTSIQAGRLAAS